MRIPLWIEAITGGLALGWCVAIILAARRGRRWAAGLAGLFVLIVLMFGEMPVAGSWPCPLCSWGYGVQPATALPALGVMLAAGDSKPERSALLIRILVAFGLVYPIFRLGLVFTIS
jgi:hypothetical protein